MLTLKQLVDGGIPLRAAIKALLEAEGKTMSGWADERGLVRTSVAQLLSGAPRRPFDEIRQELARYFAVDREWLDINLR